MAGANFAYLLEKTNCRKKGVLACALVFLSIFAACVPSQPADNAIEITRTSSAVASSTNMTPSPIPPTVVAGCSSGVITPEDARCYLADTEPYQVQRIDKETAVLLAEPHSIANWAGAVVIYHIPTDSMLVLDRLGDVNPQASIFSSRAGLAALSELAGNAEMMAGLKQQVQLKWQTAPLNEPTIRLDVAWQDGPTTVFLIAVAGLAAADDRFYCPSQSWTIGDSTEEIVSDCMAHESGTPVNHFFFESKTIKGGNERPVQVALDGLPSNVVQVSEGTVTQETLVYGAVLEQITNRAILLRAETAPGFGPVEQLDAAVDPGLLQNYRQANETTFSLRYLFHDSSVYFVSSSAAIEREILSDADGQPSCGQFRSDYPGLAGVVTLSRIGVSDDRMQALVHVLHECGPSDRLAAYYILAQTGDGWQVTNTIAAATDLPTLKPKMDYVNKANGCGDIFVYKSNRAGSEYVLVSIDTKAFALSTEPVTLNLAAHPETIGVRVDVFAEKIIDVPYCNDVGPTAVPQSVWQAVSGTVTVTVSASAETEPCTGEPYVADVVVEDVVFSLAEETVHLSSLTFSDVTVGWCAG